MAQKKDINATLLENYLEYRKKNGNKSAEARFPQFASLMRGGEHEDLSEARLAQLINDYRALNSHDQGRTNDYQPAAADDEYSRAHREIYGRDNY